MKSGSAMRRIVIVDDEPYIHELLSYLFSEHQEYEITIAEDGVAGMRIIEEKTPDIVFLDLMLPRMSGAEICRRLKASPATRNVPVILMSGSSALTTIEQTGVHPDFLLPKPFDLAQVLAIIKQLEDRDISAENARLRAIEARLNDENEMVRRTAVEELGETGSRQIAAILVKMMRHEKSVGVLEAAAAVLSRIGGAGTARELIPLLHSPEARQRNLACEILTDIGTDSVGALVELLRHPDGDIRKFAIDVLGDIGSREAVDALVEALRDGNINVACSAAESLGKIGDRRAVAALEGTARSEEPSLGYYSVVALGKIKDPAVVPFLTSLVTAGEPTVKYAAIEALGEIGDAGAVEYLKDFLSYDDKVMRRTALKSLGKIGLRYVEEVYANARGPKIKKYLLHSLSEEDKELKKYALVGLSSINEVIGVDELVEIVRQDEEFLPFVIQNFVKMGRIDAQFLVSLLDDEKMREIIPVVVGDLKDKKMMNILGILAGDPQPRVRRSALLALGKLECTEKVSLLIDHLRDEDEEVRIAAVTALGWLRSPRVIGRLIELMDGGSRRMTEAVSGALVMIGGEEAADALKRKVREGGAHRRVACVQTLGMMEPSPGIRQLLVECVRDRDSEMRKAALHGLVSYADQALVPVLEPLLKDPDPWVRIGTVKALVKTGDPKVIDLLERLTADGDVLVRFEIVKTLGRSPVDRAGALLLRMLADNEPIIQIAACESLGNTGGEGAKIQLRYLLASENADVRAAATNAIEKIDERMTA